MSTYEVYYDDSVIELPSRRLICHPHKLADALMIVDGLNRVAEMREALHRISLASQNSASSKEECGRIARAALRIPVSDGGKGCGT